MVDLFKSIKFSHSAMAILIILAFMGQPFLLTAYIGLLIAKAVVLFFFDASDNK